MTPVRTSLLPASGWLRPLRAGHREGKARLNSKYKAGLLYQYAKLQNCMLVRARVGGCSLSNRTPKTADASGTSLEHHVEEDRPSRCAASAASASAQRSSAALMAAGSPTFSMIIAKRSRARRRTCSNRSHSRSGSAIGAGHLCSGHLSNAARPSRMHWRRANRSVAFPSVSVRWRTKTTHHGWMANSNVVAAGVGRTACLRQAGTLTRDLFGAPPSSPTQVGAGALSAGCRRRARLRPANGTRFCAGR